MSGTTTVGAARRVPVRSWLSLVAVVLGVMVVQIDGSVVATANPAIATALGAGATGIQWVTTAYLLVLAGLLVPAGSVADRIGRKKAFLIGVAGFSLASLVCAFAGAIEVLVAGRLLQAAFASLLAPAGLAVIRAAFPPERIGMAFGIWGSVSAVALAGGPLLGGFLVEHASWPWVFLVNLPLGVVAVATGLFCIDRDTERTVAPLDLQGAATLTGAMVSVVWAITDVPSSGWVSAGTIGFLLLGAALLAAFLVIERRSAHPMVPLALFRNRSVTVGTAVTAISMFAFFAILFYLMFFLQGVQGWSGLAAAVTLMPLTAVFTVASPAAGYVVGKFGVRPTLVLGSAFLALSLLLLLPVGVTSSGLSLAPSLVLAGFGAGFMIVGATQAIVGNTAVEQAGTVSGVQQSAQQLGSTLGVAVFGSMIAGIIGSRFPGAVRGAVPEPLLAQLQSSVQLGFPPAAQEALSARLASGGTAPDQVQQIVAAVTSAAHETYVGGMHVVFAVAAAVAVLAGALSLLVRSPRPVTV